MLGDLSAACGAAGYQDDEIIVEANQRAQEAVPLADSKAPLTYDEALYAYLYDALFDDELRQRYPELPGRTD